MSARTPKPWTPERHEAAKAREKAATPGSWRRWQQPEGVSCDWKDALPPGSICLESTGTAFALGVAVAAFPKGNDADLAFAEHARDDVPDMLAKLEEQADEIAFYKRREKDICAALGGVGDGGRYRNDIIDAIRNRLRPEGPLTEETRQDIRKAFLNLCGSGVPEVGLAHMYADHAIGLLENQRPEWFAKGGPSNEYEPDSVSPPGETIQEAIDAVGMSRGLLAQRMGLPEETIVALIEGKAAITEDIASHLKEATGVPSYFWLNRERIYRESLTRKAKR